MVSELHRLARICAVLLVLILVLVEDGLGVSYKDTFHGNFTPVLILVLVEDGLGALRADVQMALSHTGLNPCFSGGWSRRSLETAILLK